MGGGAGLRGIISNNVAASTKLKNVSIQLKDNKGRCTNCSEIFGPAIKSWGSGRVLWPSGRYSLIGRRVYWLRQMNVGT